MVCKKCGHENYDLSKFCISCGAMLEEPVQESPVQTETFETPVTEPQQASTQNSYYQPYTPPVQQQPPVPNTPYWQPPVMPQNTGEKPVSFAKWMGIMALEYFLSLVHLILLFVWGFSSGTEASLKNYARARLVWTAIFVGLGVLLFVLICVFAGVGIADFISEFGSNPYMYY